MKQRQPTFTVAPSPGGGCDVTILTETTSRDGVAGAIRFLSQRFLKKLYAEELAIPTIARGSTGRAK